MATPNGFLTTPTKTTLNDKTSSSSASRKHHHHHQRTADSSAASFKARFEAYNRLQAAAVAFGEQLPIPEIVAIGGQSDGKSSLLEALLGFRFNVREVEMGTRRPLILQMVHDATALDPRCRFQEEDSEEYGSPIMLASAIADTIKSRTDALLKKTKTAVSSKPIVIRAEYAHCPNLTIIDTPGFVLKAKKGEPESTPEEILSMVKSLASPTHRILEFSERREVDSYLSASGYLGENTQPFFVALPKDRTTVSNDEFRRQIAQRCNEVTADLNSMDSKIQATSDVAHLRRSSMLFASAICNHLGALIDGAADPDPEQWGRTTEEERSESGIGSWPGLTADIKPPNGSLRLYGGAAFERVMHEFRCATYSIECPPVSREKVANIILAHAGRGGGRGIVEAAAEIARSAARSWLAPLLDTACERLAFVLRNLFDLAIERNHLCHADWILQKSANSLFGITWIQSQARILKFVMIAISYPAPPENPYRYQSTVSSISLEFSEHTAKGQENIPPQKNGQEDTTPGKLVEAREAYMTVPETPSPDQPSEGNYVIKKELGNYIEGGAKKRHSRIQGNSKVLDNLRVQNVGGLNGNLRSGSSYSEICSSAAQHFARIREVLVERSVTSTLNSAFLTPCRERLMVALGLDLFAVNDEKFMDMFVAPGAIDVLESERQSLQKRQKILHTCLSEFKSVARAL
ncbi:hypothetical protein OSB04_015478 [Centaurea solstitialis]|uniref:Dynamin-type G domain-containing protein n=1 Tax=Centaurea solstitialis TaxID=347529 RepID=A0AA38T6Z2_9ASTR|nr:hypothetical protein OSB04_015478 [Centaurea solstitialis]